MKVLCVCMVNRYRSPMAEAILRHVAAVKDYTGDWHVDSAGFANWHLNRPLNERVRQFLGEKGLESEHIGRQVTVDDFRTFDYIFGMDDYSVHDLKEMAPADGTARIAHLADFNEGRDAVIADPFYSFSAMGFEIAYQQIKRSCEFFVDHIVQKAAAKLAKAEGKREQQDAAGVAKKAPQAEVDAAKRRKTGNQLGGDVTVTTPPERIITSPIMPVRKSYAKGVTQDFVPSKAVRAKSTKGKSVKFQ